jgi:SAM-dependent methyltransferase
MLRKVLQEVLGHRRDDRAPTPQPAPPDPPPAAAPERRRRVLNVGGNSKAIAIPAYYEGWDHLLLDIDPKSSADIVCDARTLDRLQPDQFDAVYCSHNLEHYYKHDGLRVLRGMVHVLKADGFAEFCVPDLRSVMRKFVADEMDLEDTLYVTQAGLPITVRDVIYGWGKQIEESGVDFYAHKTGFTAASLRAALEQGGFRHVLTSVSDKRFEVQALAFKDEPTQLQRELLRLPARHATDLALPE